MSTEKPRIQAYLQPAIHDSFLKWKQERGISKDSEALNQLLAEYFGFFPQSPIPNPQTPTNEELRILIQEELWSSGKRDFIDGIKLEAQAEIARQISETKAYWEELNSLELIKDFRMRLEAKLNDLAERLEAVEGRLSELPSDSLDAVEDTRSLEQLPPDEAPGLEKGESSSTDVEGDTEEAIERDSLMPDELPGESLGESLDRPDEAPGLEPLTQSDLAKRLACNKSMVSRHKEKAGFGEWSRGKDPDAIAWRYDREKKLFIPL